MAQPAHPERLAPRRVLQEKLKGILHRRRRVEVVSEPEDGLIAALRARALPLEEGPAALADRPHDAAGGVLRRERVDAERGDRPVGVEEVHPAARGVEQELSPRRPLPARGRPASCAAPNGRRGYKRMRAEGGLPAAAPAAARRPHPGNAVSGLLRTAVEGAGGGGTARSGHCGIPCTPNLISKLARRVRCFTPHALHETMSFIHRSVSRQSECSPRVAVRTHAIPESLPGTT
eukprot:gene2189-biopygen8626